MYIQMGIQLILEEAAAASPSHLTGKPFLLTRGVTGMCSEKAFTKSLH